MGAPRVGPHPVAGVILLGSSALIHSACVNVCVPPSPHSKVDEFPLQLRDVGRPAFLIVKLDGSSRKPTWHLDMIVVESARWPPAYFVAQTWLGPSTLMEVRIPVSWVNPNEDQ